MNDGFAHYAFLVQVRTTDHEIVNNFGYRMEEKFVEEFMAFIKKHPSP